MVKALIKILLKFINVYFTIIHIKKKNLFILLIYK